MTTYSYSRIFDVCIVGAGWAGFAAMRALRRSGRSVLVIDPEFAVLHESGRAGQTACGRLDDPDWQAWCATLAARDGLANGRVDSCIAEILAARTILDDDEQLAVLSQAHVVAAERDDQGLITAVGVATKAGLLRIAATRFLDATETATLIRCIDAPLAALVRAPNRREHSCFLEHDAWPSLPADFQLTEHGLTDIDLQLDCTPWATQRRLVLSTTNASCDIAAAEAAALAYVRRCLPNSLKDAVVSQASSWPATFYSAGPSIASPAPNLALAVPGALDTPCVTLADRFRQGQTAAQILLSLPEASACLAGPIPQPELQEHTCEVLVAGLGTGGAIAAITAAEAGSHVIAIDPQPMPGGVGTGGLILGYCGGASGGRFEAVDAQANIDKAALGSSQRFRGWHPLAKGRALAQQLQIAGVTMVTGALAYAVEVHERRIRAVHVATATGAQRITATAVIDATGDGDLCAAAGCRFDLGRPGDGMVLSFTQSATRIEHTSSGQMFVRGTNYDAGWCDPRDPGDYSRARLVGIAQFLRDHYSDEHLRLTGLAPVLGLRQSRQVTCDAKLTLDDLATGRTTADSIGPVRAFLDTHAVDFAFEADEVIAWQWLMRAFREPIGCDLPYGVLIPRDLDNVWIACRAAGFTPTAAYCARMQRDIQRLGEAAGRAANLAPQGDSRRVDIAQLQDHLRASGAYSQPEATDLARAGAAGGYAALDQGQRAAELWHLYRDPVTHREAVAERLTAGGNVAFNAAVLLGLWGDPRAESPLLAALTTRREGQPLEPHQNGAFKQNIAIPDWLLAVNVLRRCGSTASLAALADLAATPALFHDIRCMIALTLEGIAQRQHLDFKSVEDLVTSLVAEPAPDRVDTPSRSIWRRLRGEEQLVLSNSVGSDVRTDHGWQLDLVVARVRKGMGESILHAKANG